MSSSRRLARVLWAVPLLAACAEPFVPPSGDLERPTVISSTPAPGAEAVERRPTIEVVFSEPVDPATVHAASFLVIGPEGEVAGAIEVAGAAARITPGTDLREGAAHRVVLTRQIRDLSGLPLAGAEDAAGEADHSFEFRTGAEPPTVVAISVALDPGVPEASFDPAAPVAVTFSEPMDPLTVTHRTLVVQDGLALVRGTVSCSTDGCDAFTFAPAEPYREGRTYRVTVSAACADASGIAMGSPSSAIFTTRRDAPSIVSTSPAEGDAGVPVEGLAVALQASEALDPATVEPSNVTVEPAAEHRLRYDEAARTVLVDFPAALVSNVTYRITLSTAIADDDGNRLAAPFTLTFTTAGAPDNNPPGPIRDLRAEVLRRRTLALLWTAPGDDVEAGTAKGIAASYAVHRSQAPIRDLAAFEAAEPVPETPPAPQEAGAEERIELLPGLYAPWHYVVLAIDDGGNASLSGDLLASTTLAETRAAGGPDGRLGSALVSADLDGDSFAELVAGAPGASEVWIFRGGPVGPDLAAAPAVLSGPAGSAFGASLAAADIDGDGAAELLVGAPAEADEAGAAYLFLGGAIPGGDASGAASVLRGAVLRDRVGWAVALGDVDGDGAVDAVVGAPGDGAVNPGAAWIASGAAGSLDLGAAAAVRGGRPGDRFGRALLAGTDLDGDGLGDLVVGVPGSDLGGTDAGHVELRSAAGTTVLVGAGPGDLFGEALAWGDANGDGAADLAVGAPFADVPGAGGGTLLDAGSASLFVGPVASGAVAVETRAGSTARELYGSALALTGPLLDGTAGALVVGAPGGVNREGSRNGAIHLLHADGAGLLTADGVIGGVETFDNLGASLAAVGDLDGDGLHDLAAGAPLGDGATHDAGRVHLYR